MIQGKSKMLQSNMQFEIKLLKSIIKNVVLEAVSKRRTRKKLRVFDFDDTLVRTDAKVYVTNAGEKSQMSAAEYAAYDKKPGDEFDYSEFTELINPKEIKWTLQILKRTYLKYGPEGVKILTARGSAEPVKKFLEDAKLDDVEVIALGTSDPKAKANWIQAQIENNGLDYVEFFDDSHKNVSAVKNLQSVFPNVKIVVRHVLPGIR